MGTSPPLHTCSSPVVSQTVDAPAREGWPVSTAELPELGALAYDWSLCLWDARPSLLSAACCCLIPGARTSRRFTLQNSAARAARFGGAGTITSTAPSAADGNRLRRLSEAAATAYAAAAAATAAFSGRPLQATAGPVLSADHHVRRGVGQRYDSGRGASVWIDCPAISPAMLPAAHLPLLAPHDAPR